MSGDEVLHLGQIEAGLEVPQHVSKGDVQLDMTGQLPELFTAGGYSLAIIRISTLSDGLEGIYTIIFDGALLGIEVHGTVALEIIECSPGIKGPRPPLAPSRLP